MDEFEAMMEEFGTVMDDLIALLPEEPTSELEAKAGQLVALGVKVMETLSAAQNEAEVEVELGDGGAMLPADGEA